MQRENRQLVEDASRGDASAVAILLERFLPDLRRFLDHRADRVVRECFQVRDELREPRV